MKVLKNFPEDYVNLFYKSILLFIKKNLLKEKYCEIKDKL